MFHRFFKVRFQHELLMLAETEINKHSNGESSESHFGESHEYCREKMTKYVTLGANTTGEGNDSDVDYDPGKIL